MFYELLDVIKKLYNQKNKQYANKINPNGAFERGAVIINKLINPNIINKELATCLIYMSKQVDAVYDVVGESKTDTIEKLDDKLKDIAVYALIAIVLNNKKLPDTSKVSRV